MSGPLRLSCVVKPISDWVRIEDGEPVKGLDLCVCEGATKCRVILDEDRARALFNWLGVWLHGGNRT